MSDDKYVKMLCRYDDIEEVDPEDQDNDIDDVCIDADYVDIVNNFGTVNFKESYLSCINEIRKGSIEKQANFCKSLIEKLHEKWNFEFPFKIDVSSQIDINKIYNLIEFVEFRCVRFLTDLLEKLYFDPYEIKKGISFEVLDGLWGKIQETIQSMNLENLIFLFLLTNNKIDTLKFIEYKINEYKTDIVSVMIYEKERE